MAELDKFLEDCGIEGSKPPNTLWQQTTTRVLAEYVPDGEDQSTLIAVDYLIGYATDPGELGGGVSGLPVLASDVGSCVITSLYGWRILKVRPHHGIDIAGGTRKLVAALAGTVEKIGWQGGYGNVVVIRTNNTFDDKTIFLFYAHLDSISVRVGQLLRQGDLVGIMGNTGHSRGVHLHFETRIGHDDKPSTWNPLVVLPAIRQKLKRQLRDRVIEARNFGGIQGPGTIQVGSGD